MAQPTFGALLYRYLERERRNGPWLAKQLGIHRATVNAWLNDDSRPQTFERVQEIIKLLAITEPHEQLSFLQVAGFGPQTRDPTVEQPAPQPPPPPQDTLREWSLQWQAWWHDFMQVGDMNAHTAQSATGRFLYAFDVLTKKLTARRWLTALLFVALWWLTLQLVAPTFHWFVTGQGNFLTAALLYLLALFTIPFVIATTVRADYQEKYEPATLRARLMLWWLKSTGAAVGFNLLSLALWFVLLMAHHAGLPDLPPLGLALMWLFPLGMAYVAARRIPADRYYMGVKAREEQNEQGPIPPERNLAREGLQPHDGDLTFFIASLLIGPLWLWFLWSFSEFLRQRTLGAIMVFSALITLAIWFTFQNKKAEGNSPRPDDPHPV